MHPWVQGRFRIAHIQMSDVKHLLCVVVRTLPNVIVFSVNLIVLECFLHFTYLVFTVL